MELVLVPMGKEGVKGIQHDEVIREETMVVEQKEDLTKEMSYATFVRHGRFLNQG